MSSALTRGWGALPGAGKSAFPRPVCLLPSRPVLPPLLPGEQLVPGDAGRPLPVCVPVCPAALLAVRVPRDPGAGEPSALPEGVGDSVLLCQTLVIILRVNSPLGTYLQPHSQQESVCCVEMIGVSMIRCGL